MTSRKTIKRTETARHLKRATRAGSALSRGRRSSKQTGKAITWDDMVGLVSDDSHTRGKSSVEIQEMLWGTPKRTTRRS